MKTTTIRIYHRLDGWYRVVVVLRPGEPPRVQSSQGPFKTKEEAAP